MAQTTAFQTDLLAIISGLQGEQPGNDNFGNGGPMGQTIKAELEDERGERINHGRLYQNLSQLADMDFLDIGQQDGRTNCYRLTDGGRELLHGRINDLQAMAGQEARA